MNKKILEEIKEAEKKAKHIVENSYTKKELIIQQGKQGVQEMIKDIALKIEQEKEKAVESKLKELEKIKQEIDLKGKKELKKIEKITEKNLNKAIKFVLKKFGEKLK